jgi:hypothetical protein
VIWVAEHPRTMAWVALMTTLNFLIAVLNSLGVL